MTENYLQIGAVAIIFLFCAKEFFSYLRAKKSNGGGVNQGILDQLQLTNTNHLMHITESIEKLNETTRNGNEKIIELLSRIEGRLSK